MNETLYKVLWKRLVNTRTLPGEHGRVDCVDSGYKAGRFSFNVKGGSCEECQGEGAITTQLYFMPDVEVTCSACKGARFNSDTRK